MNGRAQSDRFGVFELLLAVLLAASLLGCPKSPVPSVDVIGDTQAAAADSLKSDEVTSLVSPVFSRAQYNRRTGQYSGVITLTNPASSGQTLQGPLTAVISDISTPTVSVANATGIRDDGNPYFDLTPLLPSEGLQPGQSLSFTIVFDNPTRERFTFNTQVLSGMDLATVPDVLGMTQANAETTLTTAGLAVGDITQAYSATVPAGSVISQDPAAGSSVVPGSEVDLVVSLGESPEDEPFLALPKTGPVPLDAKFELSDPILATQVASWAWDFDNDGTVDSTEPEPTYRYEEAGDYTVALSITTAEGIEEFTAVEYIHARDPVETAIYSNVIVVENEPDLVYLSQTETTLTLEYSGNGPLPFEIGDILIGTAELGYARLVQAIEQSGTVLTLTTENAPLTAIFENADISCPVQFTPEDLAKAGFEKGDGDDSPRLPLDNIELAAGVFLSGSIEFEPRLDWDCRINPLYLRTAFEGTLAVNLQADVGIEGAVHTEYELSILPEKLSRIDWVQVGPIPVIVYTEFDIKAGVKYALEGKASVSTGYSSATTVRFGAEYQNGSFQPITGLSLNAERSGPEFYFEAGGSAKVFVRPEGKVRIYGILGPGASLEPYFKAELQWVPTSEITLKAGLETTLSFSLVDLEPIGFDFNGGLFTTIDYPVYVLGTWPLGDPGNVAAKPRFTATPLTGAAPLTVTFTDTSDPGSGTITEWNWDLGDGTLTGTQHPQHTYANPGTYRASLRVEGSAGQADSAATEVIHVVSTQTAPTALFTATPTCGLAPLTVQFIDLSNAGSSPISEWCWDLDGDTIVDSFTRNPSWSYESPGVYTVTLLVTTADGNDLHTVRNFIVIMSPNQSETIMLPGNVPLEMVWIPSGTFMMGRYAGEQDSRSNEDPQHQVTLSQGFWIGKYEVTQAQWRAVMGTNPSYFVGDNRPVERVSWSAVQTFISNLNSVTGRTFRLPSEAEWEYACRAGTTTRYYWGDDPSYSQLGTYAWYGGNSGSQTHSVGTKLPNAWGLFDMSGNVWEWCRDWYGSYGTAAQTDPAGPSTGTQRLVRGGAWRLAHDRGDYRSAYRGGEDPPTTAAFLGFRLAK